jgi:hypothetical protein
VWVVTYWHVAIADDESVANPECIVDVGFELQSGYFWLMGVIDMGKCVKTLDDAESWLLMDEYKGVRVRVVSHVGDEIRLLLQPNKPAYRRIHG